MKQRSSSRRVNEQARQVIAEILMFEVADPRLEMVTITGCEVSFDRSFCNVYYTTAPEHYEDAGRALKVAAGRIRSLMGAELSWRTVPELRFFLDESVDMAERIGRALERERKRTAELAAKRAQSNVTFSVTNTTLEALAEECLKRDNFVLCGHVNPDGDCIGSQLALAHALRSLGKTVSCLQAQEEPPDDNLAFLPGIDTMIPAAKFEGFADTFVALDVPNEERLGEEVCALKSRCSISLALDHHASETPLCDLTYVDTGAASCTTLVWDLIRLLLDHPPRESAVCAYTGLVTDTGCFQFQNTNQRAFDTAALLVQLGVNPSEVARNVLQNRTKASMKLDALIIERMQLCASGKGVVSWLTAHDREEVKATRADTEPLINTLRSLKGIEAACLLREQDGSIRGSLRAKGTADVAALARRFGGGGHVAAAGFTLEVPIEKAVAMVVEAFETLLLAPDESRVKHDG